MSRRGIAISALTCGTFLLLASAAGAQAAPVQVGLLVGPTMNRMVGGLATTRETDGYAGVFLRVPVGQRWAFRPEAAVSRKQVSFAGYSSSCPAEVLCLAMVIPTVDRTTFTWLEAPLLAEWRPADQPVLGVTPRFFAGPFIAVRVGAVSCVRTGPHALPDGDIHPLVAPAALASSCDDDYGQEGANPASTGDAGFIVGGVLRRGAVGLGARWTRSLTDAFRPAAASGSPLAGIRQSTVTLFVEVTPFGRR